MLTASFQASACPVAVATVLRSRVDSSLLSRAVLVVRNWNRGRRALAPLLRHARNRARQLRHNTTPAVDRSNNPVLPPAPFA